MLKFTVAQINPTIGDMEGNAARIISAAQQAHGDGAELVIFPELSLTGYYPGDLLEEVGFMQRVEAALDALRQASLQWPQLHCVIGAPMPHTGPGKPLHNALLVICAGQIVLRYAKQLLPTYGVFDERRHFEPGPDVAQVLRIGETQIGFMICEDGWNDGGVDTGDGSPGHDGSVSASAGVPAEMSADYPINPFDRMRAAAPDLVVSINASPSNIGKRGQRHHIFSSASRRHGLPIVFVNQIGGHDQLVYDGSSFAVEPNGGVVFEAQRFTEHICTLRFDAGKFSAAGGQALPAVPGQGLPRMEFYRQQIVLGLTDYARRCGFKRALVGSSGGIDSALTLVLAVQALGAENVAAVTLPSRFSSAGSVDDSVALCANLGIALTTHPIVDLVASYGQQFERSFNTPLKGLAAENLQARIRGTVLMEVSNQFGHLLLTTGNKSELSVGYCTLYGDTNGGLGLIGDLYKTEVFALSRHVNAQAGRELIPVAIIDKPPSAELAPDQKDTDSLPPYEVLDEILKTLIEGPRLERAELDQASAFVQNLQATPEGQALILRVRQMIARNEYKRRQAPPIVRVRSRAFGSGRQMPIAARHF